MSSFNARIKNVSALTAVTLGAGFALASPAGAADLYLGVSGLPSYSANNAGGGGGNLGGNFDGSAINTASGFSFQLHNLAGLVFGDTFLAGVTYDYGRSPSNQDATSASLSRYQLDTSTEWGPTIGFLFGGFRILGTYFVSGSRSYSDYQADNSGSVSSDLKQKANGGTGYRIEASYLFQLTGALGIGPSLVWKSMTYTRADQTNGVDPTQNYTDQNYSVKPVVTHFDPMVSIVLKL